MRQITLNPQAPEVAKIAYPDPQRGWTCFRIEYMRFIPQSGEARS